MASEIRNIMTGISKPQGIFLPGGGIWGYRTGVAGEGGRRTCWDVDGPAIFRGEGDRGNGWKGTCIYRDFVM